MVTARCGIIGVTVRWCRCGKDASEGTRGSADCSAKCRSVPATGGSSNCSPGAGAKQTAADRTLRRIVGITAG
jgi:hypothetical protein